MAKRRAKTAWYTAVGKPGIKQVVLISGPHKTKEDADALVARPGSRDRCIAEAIDHLAHWFCFLTVKCEQTNAKPIINDPRVQTILKAKEIAFA